MGITAVSANVELLRCWSSVRYWKSRHETQGDGAWLSASGLHDASGRSQTTFRERCLADNNVKIYQANYSTLDLSHDYSSVLIRSWAKAHQPTLEGVRTNHLPLPLHLSTPGYRSDSHSMLLRPSPRPHVPSTSPWASLFFFVAAHCPPMPRSLEVSDSIYSGRPCLPIPVLPSISILNFKAGGAAQVLGGSLSSKMLSLGILVGCTVGARVVGDMVGRVVGIMVGETLQSGARVGPVVGRSVGS